MTIASLLRTAIPKKAISGAIAVAVTIGCANLSYAAPTNRDIAWQIFERLTGTPPSNAMLDTMTDCITNGTGSQICQTGATVDGVQSIGLNSLSDSSVTGTSTMQQSLAAATSHNSSSVNTSSNVNKAGIVAATFLAMQDPNFLNVKVKDMVLPWTNKDQTVFFPFNDAAAMMIGMIRDGKDFRQLLYGDIYYDDPSASVAFSKFVFPVSNTDPQSNNDHFAYIENQNLPLKTALVATTQSGVTGMPTEGIAGVMTTRAMQRAYFYAGTNRAMLRFTFLNFLCNDLGQVKDINSNPERIRQDPSRSPGGDSSVFLNKCIGCHAGMDGMDGAFAYYNWGSAIYQPNPNTPVDSQGSVYASSDIPNGYILSGKAFPPSRVMPKYRQNFLSFPGGYETTDDSWINYWRVGLDANLGWDEGANDSSPHIVSYDPKNNSNPYPSTQANPQMGSAAQLGYELSHTVAFARCQVLHVYRHTCMNDPTEKKLEAMVGDFQGSNYNMLAAFSDAAIACSKGN